MIPGSVLDHVLSLQLTVAWAGEGRCEPRRLGWWQTDLVDPAGGGDFFRRLAPRTHLWAALQAVRAAARLTEDKLRREAANPDQILSLFHFGFEVDEQLEERLAVHKASGAAPAQALTDLYPIGDGFDRGLIERWLGSRTVGEVKVVPGGRLLAGKPPEALELLADKLAGALLPLGDIYPMPHYRVSR